MGKAYQILVVDDEQGVLNSVKKVIGSRYPDYHLELVGSPSKALNKLKDKKYDLIITDLMMPGIDGLELIKRIRTLDENAKIMMMTGFATMKTALLAMREGAAKYISKPFTRSELLEALDGLLPA